MKKKIKLIFLGRGKIASDCFSILNNNFFKNYFEIKAVVSAKNFFLNNKKNIPNDAIKIMNNKNSENRIFKIIQQKKINLLISVLHPWLLSERVLKKLTSMHLIFITEIYQITKDGMQQDMQLLIVKNIYQQ